MVHTFLLVIFRWWLEVRRATMQASCFAVVVTRQTSHIVMVPTGASALSMLGWCP
jgi:hypothetical protein